VCEREREREKEKERERRERERERKRERERGEREREGERATLIHPKSERGLLSKTVRFSLGNKNLTLAFVMQHVCFSFKRLVNNRIIKKPSYEQR